MDVGEVSNAAGLVASGAAVLGTAQGTGGLIIDGNLTSTVTNTVTNLHANAGWWTPNSTIVAAPANTDVMNQLCRVCGEPAAGFHFGAFTCEGCKSFFGRTYNNLGSISECKNGGVCVINKKNRTACKACRLRKCLMVGMSKSGSRYGRRSNWFKIHCLLQEQSHQARLKDPTKSPFEKVLNQLDAANNNNGSNSAAVSGASLAATHGRLIKTDEQQESSARTQVPRSDVPAHDLPRPEPTRFPMWRAPPFFHPALSHMQFLNTPFFAFQHNFGVPYVNQIRPEMPVTSISSSSSDSISPRSSPSPKIQDDSKSRDVPNIDEKSIAYYHSLGPEQVEPMDLSKKSLGIREVNDDSSNSDDTVVDKPELSDHEGNVIETEIVPPLDLSWKT